ncbi:unnamed protein product [Didymodactylos carnosus]|uniref:Uncharacterized protein n=1 Tax=Didymodactylos carnosus TaxID=1234261 RepID=A0A814GCJ9_9BILA|nr:unnamed protein product [Didymodactylos carnosus]CAF0992800.1 unnamed protein product [Didymodactylos carnosus]CAF3663610.1 unnamed protein product [Didymodactylos carnosus]CAF3764661.1 unnamed protein product [Didymodactylos carnosus]
MFTSPAHPQLDSLICTECNITPSQLTCACSEKLCFGCIQVHIERIRREFELVHEKVGQRFIKVDDLKHRNNIPHVENVIQKWKTERMRIIDDIASNALKAVEERTKYFSGIPALKTDYDSMPQWEAQIGHEQLNQVIDLDQKLVKIVDPLTALPTLEQDDHTLEQQLKTQLSRLSLGENNIDLAAFAQPSMHDASPDITERIMKTNPIVIPCKNDEFHGAFACHDDELIFNTTDSQLKNSKLVFISNVNRTGISQEIPWPHNWIIVDIEYAIPLRSYLIATGRQNSKVYNFHPTTSQIDEWKDFNDRNLKRLCCTTEMVYLVFSTQDRQNFDDDNSDELIALNYTKEEQVFKTINQLVKIADAEIIDLSCSDQGQVAIAYRFNMKQQVAICLFDQQWSPARAIELKGYKDTNIWYTPRLTWSNQFDAFLVVEHKSGHLVVIDSNSKVKGETRIVSEAMTNDIRQLPVNVILSNNNWIGIRCEVSINIYQINKT